MTVIALVILLTVVYFTNIRKMKVPNRLRAQIMELESDRILTNKKIIKAIYNNTYCSNNRFCIKQFVIKV